MIYTMGYSGWKIQDIKMVAEKLDATVFDVRYSPRSQNQEFSSRRMAKALGDRYMHVQGFGNKNYRGGPIELMDFAKGLGMIVNHRRRNIILLCVCKSPIACHRTTLASNLRDYGYIVQEYELPKKEEAVQLILPGDNTQRE